ncbi:MAG TPA: hypothetical protein PKD86_10550 [Gemmatales bacterium]|nr:hypothetical protein [Gemmatales bacterium]HMP59784.1 hypothetical protein [Gemmatales bacterium]
MRMVFRALVAGALALAGVESAQAQYGAPVQPQPRQNGQVRPIPGVQPVPSIAPVQPVQGFAPANDVFGEPPMTWQEKLRAFLVRYHIMKPVPDPPVIIPGNDYQSPNRMIPPPQRLRP